MQAKAKGLEAAADWLRIALGWPYPLHHGLEAVRSQPGCLTALAGIKIAFVHHALVRHVAELIASLSVKLGDQQAVSLLNVRF